jgi:hypothetical protein
MFPKYNLRTRPPMATSHETALPPFVTDATTKNNNNKNNKN